MTIIHMPKRKVLRPPSAGARMPKDHVKMAEEPSLETTVMEAVAIRKWLHFALEDIHFQLREMSKDKSISPRSFKESKHTAALISSYLIGILQDVEQRLTSMPSEAS